MAHPTVDDDLEKSLNDLPKAYFWDSPFEIRQWEGFWFERGLIKPAMKFRANFKARDGDVLLASFAKTGTTWLKSLALCITQNYYCYSDHQDILTKDNPHFLLPTVESMLYSTKPLQYNHNIYDDDDNDGDDDDSNYNSPRLMHTHLPYRVLPESVKISSSTDSGCKIVYIARNPKDTLVSFWHFFNSILRHNQEPYPLDKFVDCFCDSGAHQYGPYFDHVSEYWLESKRRPEKILFVRYEEMKNDPKGQVSKIAEFMGKPFKSETEVDDVLWRCSLDRLKNLEVNKNGSVVSHVPNGSYFRKGVVGDYKNYLTTEMEEKIDRMSREKFEPHGLVFI